MHIIIDGQKSEIDKDFISEHISVMKEALLSKYTHIDTLARTSLRFLSQHILNKLFEATANDMWKLPSKKDVSVHLLESIFQFLINELSHIDIEITVENSKVKSVCVIKENDSQ